MRNQCAAFPIRRSSRTAQDRGNPSIYGPFEASPHRSTRPEDGTTREHDALIRGESGDWVPQAFVVQPWPARTTIKRTFRALERWIEDREANVSGNEYQIARDALNATGELDQPRAEKLTLIVQSARARLLTFIEEFDPREVRNQPNG